MTRKANLLVVDDESIERQTLSEILKLEGYHVTSVPSGEAAIDHLRINPVDLMVLDLRMPGMSGLDVIKIANRTFPEIEIILLTAHGSMESAIEALRSNVLDYILKPASPTQILDCVKKGLKRKEEKTKLKELNNNDVSTNQFAIVSLGEDILIDFGRRFVKSGKIIIYLTPAEGRLLQIFVENSGKVFSHRELVLLVQGYSTTPIEAPEILRPLVSRLRLKLNNIPSIMQRIVSVRGTGYVFEQRI